MLPNLVGRDVCIVGTALRVAPSGQRIHIRCADGRESIAIFSRLFRLLQKIEL
ncbi:unnamed protein product [Schistosoma mattheei]|uniref:Uncharacterized protein n=1 Tax=Schistosoma mattheei TaxID=31246 RepID=A0AA85BMJ3_9TREM|nr:unnamed protein product [Schistosoma mattheei]